MTDAIPTDNALAARTVARSCRKAALATLDRDGAPYVSLVTFGLDHDLAPILIISAMSMHTRNIQGDGRVSFLFDGTDGFDNPQEGPRLTLMGKAAKDDDRRLRARFLARNPAAQGYAEFGDFSLWRIQPTRGQFVGGFGRAHWLDAPFGLDNALIAAFKAEEGRMMGRLADEGRTDVLAVDPDGFDRRTETGVKWMAFNATAATPDDAVDLILGR